MDIVQLCEIGMLVAFGFSWPFNIIKSWRSRTAKGKSVIFELRLVLLRRHRHGDHRHRSVLPEHTPGPAGGERKSLSGRPERSHTPAEARNTTA